MSTISRGSLVRLCGADLPDLRVLAVRPGAVAVMWFTASGEPRVAELPSDAVELSPLIRSGSGTVNEGHGGLPGQRN